MTNWHPCINSFKSVLLVTLRNTLFKPSITILVIMVLMTFFSSNMHWGKDRWKGILESDAKGYYAYLPAVFIYQDLHFNFFEKIEMEKYYNENTFFEYRAHVNDTTINKFFCGTAVTQMPFFLIAHMLSPLSGHEQDGYSKLYMISVCVAALFYLMLGLIFINKLLSRYGIHPVNISITLITVVFATNVFYYTVGEAGMSHIYSFGVVAMFLFTMKKYFEESKHSQLYIASFLLGLVVLIRPVNGLIILLAPFLAGNFTSFYKGIEAVLKNKWSIVTVILVFAAIVFLQPLYYKISVDSFFVYSYEYEKFNFHDPHMFDILFSYKKGLFVYSPVLLLSLAGMYYVFQKNSFEFYSSALFLVILTYVLASWWNWWYGGSFSSRVYLEYIPIFGIFLAIAIQKIKGFKRYIYLTLTGICLVVCQIQTYQYRYYQIHWENMDKETYWEVFLRIDRLL